MAVTAKPALLLPILALALVSATALLVPAADEASGNLDETNWNLASELARFFAPDDLDVDFNPEFYEPPIVPTVTNITRHDAEIEKQHPFLVEGTVEAEGGGAVANARVEIYLHDDERSGFLAAVVRTNERGEFEAQGRVPTFVPAGAYDVVAKHAGSFDGQVFYKASESDPEAVDVVSDTRLTLHLDGDARTGEPILLRGRLVDVRDLGVANKSVTLLVNGAAVDGARTNSDGTYSFHHTFEDPGETAVSVRFEGSTHHRASEVARLTVVEGDGLVADGVVKLVRGDTWHLEGRFIVDGKPARDREVTVSFPTLPVLVDGTRVHEVTLTTDAEGRYRVTLTVAHDASPESHDVTHRAEGFERVQRVDVLVRTTLILDGVPDRAGPEGFAFTVRLVDDQGNGIEAAALTAYLRARHLDAVTDENGYARFETGALDEGGVLGVAYDGSVRHAPASESRPYEVASPIGEAWWFLPSLLVILGLAGLAAWAFFAKGVGRLRAPYSIATWIPATPAGAPHVFETGEAVPVHVKAILRSRRRSGWERPLAGARLEVRLGDSVASVTTDAVGEARAVLEARGEGALELTTTYPALKAGRLRVDSPSLRVSIVPYRRAIEDAYADLVRLARSEGLPVTAGTTPHELKAILLAHLPRLDTASADRILALFEIADFSERVVDRNAWLTFLDAASAAREALAARAAEAQAIVRNRGGRGGNGAKREDADARGKRAKQAKGARHHV